MIFPVQLPSLGELKSRRYYISMSSSEGHTFLNRQFVSFFGESNGHMLVKTDKPIYKPAQTGMFTIRMRVDNHLRHTDSAKRSI